MRIVGKLFLIVALLCAHSFAQAISPDASLTQIGVAEYSQLRKPYYIAGIFSAEPANSAKRLLSVGDHAKRLEYRIVAETYSQRRFSSQLSQALIINSTQDELMKFDQALVQFQNIVNQPFVAGDHIVIAADASGSSSVFLNGIKSFSVKRPGFLELIMNTWVGNKPPSTGFKQQLLSNSAPSDVVTEFNNIAPSATRVDVVKAALKAVNKPEKPDSKPVLVAQKADLVKDKSAQLVSAESIALPTSTKTASSQTPPINSPTPSVPTVAVAIADIPSPLVEEEEPEVSPEVYQQQQLTLIKLYANSATRNIRSQVKYPKRALQMEQEGTAFVEVAVNRNGVIESMLLVEKTRYKGLNNAALKAIESAGRLNAIPPAIDADYVTFTIPFSFRMQ